MFLYLRRQLLNVVPNGRNVFFTNHFQFFTLHSDLIGNAVYFLLFAGRLLIKLQLLVIQFLHLPILFVHFLLVRIGLLHPLLLKLKVTPGLASLIQMDLVLF